MARFSSTGPEAHAARRRAALRLLVTHGTLQICGWDHAEPAEETEMRALERRLPARLRPPGAS